MFKLVTASDRVAINAQSFGVERHEAYAHVLNRQYANRVVDGLGLVVGVWSVLSVGVETLQMSCGRAVADVVFRVVVFAPFVGEAVWTTIGGASADVLLLAMPFFGALRVPPSALPRGTQWDKGENVWVWQPDDTDASHRLFLDVSNDVVARVTCIQFSAPSKQAGSTSPPMRIAAALTDSAVEDSQGLGDPQWWYEEEEQHAAPLEEDAALEDVVGAEGQEDLEEDLEEGVAEDDSDELDDND